MNETGELDLQLQALLEKYGQDASVDTLARYRDAREALDRLIARDVMIARDEQWSWAQIGAALGISKQAAQKRYGSPRPLTDARRAQPSKSAQAARETALRHGGRPARDAFPAPSSKRGSNQ